ncbi:SsrA-binding protein SmpB [Candidatus Dojkabacteria bacterium]|jgi:SsrA-binding protein|nr:SsrA-binding protein SmpB [Candidatus Dojkabacteria bacterium]
MIENKKARLNYEVKETLEAGLVLTGAEVKAIRDNRINISESFVKVLGGEMYLINADIAKYKFSSDDRYDSTRSRKLLVHKKEMEMLNSKSKQGGLTLVPLKIFFEHGRAKVLIGLARGRKRFEKKNKLKERDLERELHLEKRKYMV